MAKKNNEPDPADQPDAQASAQVAGLNPAGPYGRQTASDPEQRDRAVQDANPGYTTPYDQAGQPAPKTAADIAVDPAQNPHNVQTIPTTTAEHYRGGRLTREGMLNVVRRGGSFLHRGHVINQERHVPSEADLALHEAQVHGDMSDRLREIERQLPSASQADRATLTQERENIKRAMGTMGDPGQSQQQARDSLLRQKRQLDEQLARLDSSGDKPADQK